MRGLDARIGRLEKQMEQTALAGRRHLIYVDAGKNVDEAIERQKRELGVTDEDQVFVVQFVAQHEHGLGTSPTL